MLAEFKPEIYDLIQSAVYEAEVEKLNPGVRKWMANIVESITKECTTRTNIVAGFCFRIKANEDDAIYACSNLARMWQTRQSTMDEFQEFLDVEEEIDDLEDVDSTYSIDTDSDADSEESDDSSTSSSNSEESLEDVDSEDNIDVDVEFPEVEESLSEDDKSSQEWQFFQYLKRTFAEETDVGINFHAACYIRRFIIKHLKLSLQNDPSSLFIRAGLSHFGLLNDKYLLQDVITQREEQHQRSDEKRALLHSEQHSMDELVPALKDLISTLKQLHGPGKENIAVMEASAETMFSSPLHTTASARAFGQELRTPLLDHKIVENLHNITHKLKTSEEQVEILQTALKAERDERQALAMKDAKIRTLIHRLHEAAEGRVDDTTSSAMAEWQESSQKLKKSSSRLSLASSNPSYLPDIVTDMQANALGTTSQIFQSRLYNDENEDISRHVFDENNIDTMPTMPQNRKRPLTANTSHSSFDKPLVLERLDQTSSSADDYNEWHRRNRRRIDEEVQHRSQQQQVVNRTPSLFGSSSRR